MGRNYQLLGTLWMENPVQRYLHIHFPAGMIQDEESKPQDFEKERGERGPGDMSPHHVPAFLLCWLASCKS